MNTPLDLIDREFDLDSLLTAEEVRWRDKARALARDLIRPGIDDDFEANRLRSELVPALGEAGLLGMHLDGYGCAGANSVSYGLACMELEAVDSSWRTLVSVQGSLAMAAIAKFGSEQQKQRWLPSMAAGEMLGAFGLTEPQGGSDPAGMTTRAERDGSDWVLTGSKRWIGLASIAGVIVVWAQTAEGLRGFLVPAGTAGMEVSEIRGKLSMRASVQCDIEFDRVRVPQDAMLPEARGLSGPFSCLNEARYGIIWGVMGAARDCLESALGRSMQRQAFGKPLASMQLTQLKLADMFVSYERGTLLALHLGHAKDAGRLLPTQISVGKLNNVRDAIEVARTARTILAGDGITDEFPVMRHMANLESVRTYEGTDEVHSLVIGRALTGMSAFA